jgi:ATP-dependent DNA ligase
MAEPWMDRRTRLEDLFPDGITDHRMQLAPTFEDAARLWPVWVLEWGGEGIVLEDHRSTYRPGMRSRSWWGQAQADIARRGAPLRP